MLEGTSPVLRREGSRKAPDLSDYNAHALDVFFQAQFPIWLEASLQIKQAGGLQRGKSYSVDAQRIAEYAYRFQDRIRLWKPARPVMKKLAEFTRLRQRLQGMINQLRVPLAEQKQFGDKALTTQLGQHCSSSLKALLIDLKGVEKAIKQLIDDDSTLKSLFELVIAPAPRLYTWCWSSGGHGTDPGQR